MPPAITSSQAAPASDSLSDRTLDAFAWRFASESSKLTLQIAVQVVLARLLPIEAFGLLAVASLVVNLGTRIAEIGTGAALIQRSAIDTTHIRVAFSVSALGGAVASLLIALAAPAAADLFNTPEVTPILRFIGLVFVIGGVGTTAEALMLRRMEYRRLMRVELLSYGVGYAAVGITLAILGYGVWSLAWATVTQTTVKAALLLAARPHPIRLMFASAEAGQLLNFGIGTTLGRLAAFAAQNADYFVVARWLGTTALGLYVRAFQIMSMPIYQFSAILNTVLFSAYSTIQNDAARLRRGYLSSVSLCGLVVFPMLTAVAIVTPELMAGVFGPQWRPAAGPLTVLCAAGAMVAVCNVADSVIRARGAVYMKFGVNAIYATSVFVGSLLGMRWQITGVAAGVLSATALMYLLTNALSLRLTGAKWADFFEAQAPAAAVCLAVVAVAWPVTTLLRYAALPPLAVLAGSASASAVTAIVTVIAMPQAWLTPAVRENLERARRYGASVWPPLRRHDPTATV